MSSQIRFFEKNFIDLDFTAVENDPFVNRAHFLRDRTLGTAFTGSVNTHTVNFNLGESKSIDSILFLDTNFASVNITLKDASDNTVHSGTYSNSANEDAFIYELTPTLARKVTFTVTSKFGSLTDYLLGRLVVTRSIGQLNGWPEIRKPKHDSAKKVVRSMSGRAHITRRPAAFEMSLRVRHWKDLDDLALVESLYRRYEGFEVWPSGGSESQFHYPAMGYRKKDLYLMQTTNEFQPEFVDGIYSNGFNLQVDLIETLI